MHSFHQSRGRIFFDIFCALTIGVACAIAWLQTGASALLAIAGVAAAYSLVHATDAPARRRDAAPKAEAVADEQGDLLAYVAPAPVEVMPVVAEPAIEEPKQATAPAKKPSRKKKAAQRAVCEAPPAEMPVEEASCEVQEVNGSDDDYHLPIAPLFEPQPLVRQQRTVFGRKSG